jgi:hypothetical protein
MEKVLNTITNCYGDEIPSAVLFQENGLLRMWEINCYSSLHHNLGNCHCVNHSPSDEYPVSTTEVISQFGKEALDGFELHTTEQLVFDEFGIEIDELEKFIQVAYRLDMNPLPALRKKTTHPVIFLDGDINFAAFEGEEIIFIVNSRGEISAEIAPKN